MRRLRFLLPLLALLVAVPSPAATAQDAGSGVGIQLLEAPREAADNPRARLYIIDEVNPGATFTREIQVTNNTEVRQRLELYAAAASADDGWSVAEGREQNALSRWVTVDPEVVTLGPAEASVAEVTVSVPGDATPGEHYAAVLAEAPPEEEGAVTVVGRVGIRMYLFVRGEEPPRTDFEIDTLRGGRSEDGTPVVLIGIVNTGDRAVDVRGDLRLSDGPGSLSAGPFDVAIPRTVGPGGVGEVTVFLDPELPAGPWTATADLRSGLLERSAEARITFPEEPGTLADPVEASPVEQQRRILIPLAGSLILILLVVLAVLWWRRRREDREEDEQDGDRTRAHVGG